MKRYYVFIPIASLQLPDRIVVYRTQVGENKRDEKTFLQMQEMSKALGFFFEKYSTQVYEFLHNLEKSYTVTKKFINFHQLARQIKNAYPRNVKNLSPKKPVCSK